MMIKVGNEFLEFNELVEMEKQVKLLEDLSTSDGDFSYSFSLQKTITNSRILQNPQPDNINKPVYQKIEASLLSDSGEETFKGFLRIEGITNTYQCSFFAGNNNWFGLLSGNMRDIDWSEFDVEMTQSTLSAALFNTSGTVFPLVDNGLLVYRGVPQLKVEDFVGAIYLKNILQKVFSVNGIKIQGDLIEDADYQNSIILTNGKSERDIEANSIYAESPTGVARPAENVDYKILFTNDDAYPYYDGTNDSWNTATSMFTAAYKMQVLIEVNCTPEIVDASYNNRIYLYINGVFTFVDIGLSAGGLYNSATGGDSEIFTLKRRITLEASDTLEIYTEWQQSGGSTANNVTHATVKITPVFIYKAFGWAMVPDWTQGGFVAEVFKQFCVLPSYDASNMTLTANLFEKLRGKQAIDLSIYISEVEIDYTEFISEYGKESLLSHQETTEEEDFQKINPTRRSYETGVIEVSNDFLEDSAPIIESKFSAPITYINEIFSMSQEKTNIIEFETDTKIEFTAVIDSPSTPGRARFTIAEDIFLLSDMVRIENSTNPFYNGDFMVITIGTGYFELRGLAFDTDATGEATHMNFVYSGSEQVYLLHHVPLYSVTNFSGLVEIPVENTDYETLAPAFYNLMFTSRPIDFDFPFSMAFAPGDQISFTDRYFRLLSRVLNDPVKLLITAHLPFSIYKQLDFLSPVTIKANETQNQYYLNKISGYKESYLPATLELIKLP